MGKEHCAYLLRALRKNYARITEDWSGSLYAGTTLNWNYDDRWVDSSMPGYVSKLRTRFNHKMPKKPVHSPYKARSKVYGAAAQDVLEDIESPKLNEDGIHSIQQVVGVCM